MRLDKGLVKLVRGATVPRTAKGSVIRAQVHMKFDDAIESVNSDEEGYGS